ncbi:hypothetical protein [Photobacterium swingsii]|uniref:hypothetical protein n=1 Tax=Photobacterium swingsii TaxID=680026 RepID=UPI004067EA95
MTGKTLREQLPVGDPRNKVEFLADELENRSAELLKLLGKASGIRSWVHNGAFLDNITDKVAQLEYKGDQINNSVVGSSNQNSCGLGDGWAFAASSKNDPSVLTGAFSAKRQLYWHGFSKAIPFDSQSIWCMASNVKGSIYQVIQLPNIKAKYKARIYFSTEVGAKITVGASCYSSSGSLYPLRVSQELISTRATYDSDNTSPHFGAFDVQTLESQEFEASRAGEYTVLFVEIDPQAESKSLFLHGVELIRSDKNPTWEAENVTHQTDMLGYQRFVDGLNYTCRDFIPETPNIYTFKSDRPKGVSFACPQGFDKHFTFTGFYIGNKAYSNADGVKLLSVDGDTITVFIPDNIVSRFGDARFLDVYLNWSAMPVRIGLYQ